MSRQSRRARNRRKKIIIRRRIILFVFILILIPLLYKGGKNLITTSIETISNKGKDGGKEQNSKLDDNEKSIFDKEDDESLVELTNAKILSVGDIMFHMPQVKSAYQGNGKYSFDDSFKYVKKYISKADISIGNFETVTAGNDKKFSGFPQFNSPKETLLSLKNSGFDIISTANNHSLDQGKEGLINTIKYANEYGLKNLGTYEEEVEKNYLIEEKNGIKMGFIAYTYGLNGLEFYLSEEELSYMVNLIDENKIEEDIKELKKETDIVVISLHWGSEYQREASQEQIDLGHKIIDWGADIVLGSHPHVLQKSEIIKKNGKDSFIIYSQGNFLSNQRKDTMGNELTEDGVMVEIELEKDLSNDNTIVKNVEFIPTWIYKYKENDRELFKILPTRDVIDGSLEIELDEETRERINKSQEDSMKILKD